MKILTTIGFAAHIQFATMFADRVGQLSNQIAALDPEHCDYPRFSWSYEADPTVHFSDADTIYLMLESPSNRDTHGDWVCSHDSYHTIPIKEILERTEEEDECNFPFPSADKIRGEIVTRQKEREQREYAEQCYRANRIAEAKKETDLAELRRLQSLYPQAK